MTTAPVLESDRPYPPPPIVPQLPAVTFVETVGPGSMDACAQELGPRLGVPTLRTDVYRRAAAARNSRLLTPTSLRSLAHEIAFAVRLRALDTVVHLPNHHLARYGPFIGQPYVVTVHDVIRQLDCRGGDPLIHLPSRRDRIAYARDRAGIAQADAVIAISEATRRDVVEHLQVPPERVHVVYNGLDHTRFRPIPGRPIEAPYVLFVGSEHPRKNLATLLRAFKRLKDDGDRETRLVKIGDPGGCEAPFRARTERLVDELGLRDDVVFAGRVTDDELPRWYTHAECLVLPSLYEGFGNPPLEAMACGCPIVTSDAPALVEVAGGAGLVAPATDDAAFADAIGAVVGDAALRADLRQRGLARARSFSWERAARETLAAYEAVVGPG
jgi:glycosyltransferase involved in cell wall biosynthesis